MKKLIITAICATVAVSGFSQGTVQFQNGAAQAPKLVVPGVSTNNATSATIGSQTANGSSGVLDIGIFWGTTATTATNFGGVIGMSATTGVFAGNANFALSGTNPNDVDFIGVDVWDSSYGNTAAGMLADIAAGGYFGSYGTTTGQAYGTIATPLSFSLGASAGPGVPIFGTIAGLYHSVQVLVPVPEPTTIALGGLGAAALLLFRRRK